MKKTKGLFEDFTYEFLDYFHNCDSAVKIEYKKSNISYTIIVNIILGKEEIEEFNLHVNYKNIIPRTKRFNYDNEVLVCRFLDKIFRPIGNQFIKREIVINILSFSNIYNLIDQKMISAFGAIVAMKKLFNVDIGVSFGIFKEEFLLNPIGYKSMENDFKIILAGREKELITLEFEGKPINHKKLKEFIDISLKECEKLREHLSIIKSKFRKRISKKNLDISKKNLEDLLKDKNISRKEISSFLCKNKQRIDNRKIEEIRPISCESITKNSVVFARGDTVCCSLIDINSDLQEQKNLNIKYVFNGFATGEIYGKKTGNRREIGHGELIRKALQQVVNPSINLNAQVEVFSSNGSSSMGSICAISAALYKNNIVKKEEIVTGLSYGLFRNEKDSIILTDITAAEDNISEVDFKIAGTKEGITAIQLDSKSFFDTKYLGKILELGQKNNKKIAEKIVKEIKVEEDKTEVFKLNKEKIGLIIGSNGSKIKQIAKISSSKIKVHQDGTIILQGKDLNLVKQFLNFYGVNALPLKTKVAFFVKEDCNSKEILTSIGIIKYSKKINLKKGQIISAIVKEWEENSRTIKNLKIISQDNINS